MADDNVYVHGQVPADYDRERRVATADYLRREAGQATAAVARLDSKVAKAEQALRDAHDARDRAHVAAHTADQAAREAEQAAQPQPGEPIYAHARPALGNGSFSEA